MVNSELGIGRSMWQYALYVSLFFVLSFVFSDKKGDYVRVSRDRSYTTVMIGNCSELKRRIPRFILMNRLVPQINGYEEAVSRLTNMLICRKVYDRHEEDIICVISFWIPKKRYTIEVVCYRVSDLFLYPYFCFREESIYDCVDRFDLDYVYRFSIDFYSKYGSFEVQENIYGALRSYMPELELRKIKDSLKVIKSRLKKIEWRR